MLRDHYASRLDVKHTEDFRDVGSAHGEQSKEINLTSEKVACLTPQGTYIVISDASQLLKTTKLVEFFVKINEAKKSRVF